MTLPAQYGEAISVTRYAAGSFVAGAFVAGTPSTLNLTATVVPLTPFEIKLLAEGQEDMAGITIYSDTELRTSSEAAKTAADVVTWSGKTWLVKSSEYRGQIPSLAHWKMTALAEDVI